ATKGKVLNWEKRLKILIGTAEGLVYLHENTKIRIIHRDIKAANILLDMRLRAKIADFGLARSFQDDKSHISTAIAGTLGYMAPEYLAHGQLTEKADVYSFGVLLLEVVTGMENNKSKTLEYTDSLVAIAWRHFQQNKVEEIFDPNLMMQFYPNSNNLKDATKVVQVGLLCTQEDPSLRPSMSTILKMLAKDNEPLPAPSNPPFMDEDTMELNDIEQKLHHYFNRDDSGSVATVSQSRIFPRISLHPRSSVFKTINVNISVDYSKYGILMEIKKSSSNPIDNVVALRPVTKEHMGKQTRFSYYPERASFYDSDLRDPTRKTSLPKSIIDCKVSSFLNYFIQAEVRKVRIFLLVLVYLSSTWDLYPVTASSPIPHAFFFSQHTWHQRLGHSGGEVLHRLVSFNFISYNKEKPPVLCHACQLGKHVRLPFVSFNTMIRSCFDIIHSNVWTSPILSLSDDTFDLQLTVLNSTLTTPIIGHIDPLPHQQHPTKHAAQQSPIATQPTPASPSSAQLHSLVQQPSPVAQHTPVQLQFSPTAVPHQTTTISDQHAPHIVQNPTVSPNPNSVHPMVTRFCVGTNRPTKRLNLHVSSVSPLPKSYRDAFSDPNWQNAMRDEYHALIKNKTQTLVPRPPNTNIMRCMWLFRHKYLADGTLSRYKARLVANGSTQLEWVDSDETFSPVVKPGTIRTVLSLLLLDIDRFINSIHETDTAYLLLYVDDIVLTASFESLLQQIILHQKFAMTDVCLHMHDPREPHFSALKRILRYVRGTLDYGLQSFSTSTTDLVAYSDADWAGSPTTRRSTSEAEYRGVANVVAETCWLRNELHTLLSFATLVYCDNVSAVYLSCNPIQHQDTKHIEIDIHFVRDLVDGQVRVLHVPSRYQYADIFTKGLPSTLFEEFHNSLSVRCPLVLTAGEY
nr:cysteine-rich receptor-like protein kinase 2 [Tanacetum cinerariifolium]